MKKTSLHTCSTQCVLWLYLELPPSRQLYSRKATFRVIPLVRSSSPFPSSSAASVQFRVLGQTGCTAAGASKSTPAHSSHCHNGTSTFLASAAVLPFKPKHRLGHPENYIFLSSNNIFIGPKYSNPSLSQTFDNSDRFRMPKI